MIPDKSRCAEDKARENGLVVHRVSPLEVTLPTTNGATGKELHPAHSPPINGDALHETITANHKLQHDCIELSDDVNPVEEPLQKKVRHNEWNIVPASEHAKETRNRIRTVVEVLSVEPNPEKKPIKLNLGDPSITGTLSIHPTSQEALSDAVASGQYNGYGPAVGFPHVRDAVAAHFTHPNAPITKEDVILTSGCSHALQLAIEAIANPGQNILVPSPGFPLYETLMAPHKIEPRFYGLLPDRSWEIDLAHMESLIDPSTACIIVNNPSNPSGAVYNRSHLEAILSIAARYEIPIIADEIYGDMTYNGAQFHPLSQLEPKVPILTCDGIAKRWLVPGWRLGWLIIHDHQNALKEVRTGIWQLATKIVGPCALIQGAVPAMLQQTPPEFFQYTRDVLAQNAKIVYSALKCVPGIRPIRPSGAMYIMLIIDLESFGTFATELDLTQGLIREESIYCLPGTAFHYPNSLRLVLTYAADTMSEACQRIAAFCNRHYKEASNDGNEAAGAIDEGESATEHSAVPRENFAASLKCGGHNAGSQKGLA